MSRIGDLLYSLVKATLVSSVVAVVALAAVGLAWSVVRPHPPVGERLAIVLAQNHVKSGVDTVTDLVLKAVGVSQNEHVDDFAEKQVGKLRGEVMVTGWAAKEITQDLYLVTFSWTNQGETWEIPFEVNTANRYIRPILIDDNLALKYQRLPKDEYERLEEATRAAIDRKLGSGAVRLLYADHVLKVAVPPGVKLTPSEAADYLYKAARPLMGSRHDRYLKVVARQGDETATFDGEEAEK
jgi:hypothetical protein